MAISIRQPWASLILDGRKHVETRSWRPPSTLIRRRIAIHASKKPPAVAQMRAMHVTPEVMPLGAVIATARLDGCEPVTVEVIRLLSADELDFGDYSPGRFAWYLADVRPVNPPIYLRGRQGFFDVGQP